MVGLHGGGIAQLQCIGNQGMTDGDFEHAGHLAHKGGEVVAVEIMPGIHAQAGIQRRLGGGGVALQLLGLLRRAQAAA